MISLKEAWKRIDKQVTTLPAEDVALEDAGGCSLAENIVSNIDVPGFASSAMDGVAIRLADLVGDPPWKLTLEGVIAAGDDPHRRLTPGHCVKIMTGAPLPSGANTVIKIEDLEFESGRAVIKNPPPKGQFVRNVGDDIRRGEAVFRKGAPFKPVDVGIIASLGLVSVKAIPNPSIAIMSTGAEVVHPGKPLQPGQIYNSNYYSLLALLNKDGYNQTKILPHVNDEPDIMLDTLKSAVNEHHVILTAGGVSAGDFDYVPQVVEELEGELLFHKVSIKPGKPILLARLGKAWLIGLPGNPVSVVSSYIVFVRRVLSKLRGSKYTPEYADAVLGTDVNSAGKRIKVIGVRLEKKRKALTAQPAQDQKSGRLSSVKGMDGVIYMDARTNDLAKGAEVKVELI